MRVVRRGTDPYAPRTAVRQRKSPQSRLLCDTAACAAACRLAYARRGSTCEHGLSRGERVPGHFEPQRRKGSQVQPLGLPAAACSRKSATSTNWSPRTRTAPASVRHLRKVRVRGGKLGRRRNRQRVLQGDSEGPDRADAGTSAPGELRAPLLRNRVRNARLRLVFSRYPMNLRTRVQGQASTRLARPLRGLGRVVGERSRSGRMACVAASIPGTPSTSKNPLVVLPDQRSGPRFAGLAGSLISRPD